jgi:hypothetical protein
MAAKQTLPRLFSSPFSKRGFTGKGKLENIGKVTEFFASLGIPLPTLNAYFIGFARMFRQLAFNYRFGIATSVPSDRNLDERCLSHCGFRGRIEYFQRS